VTDPDVALLVAFDESEDQQRATVRTRYNRQTQLLRFARSCSLLTATTADLVGLAGLARPVAGRPGPLCRQLRPLLPVGDRRTSGPA
jgi:hypothetical protein